MSYISRVEGSFAFSRRRDTSAEAAKRAEVARLASEVGDKIVFEDAPDGLSKQHVKTLQHDEARFSNIQDAFRITSKGLHSTGNEVYRGFELTDEFRALTALAEADGVDVNGDCRIEGEESGDIWKIIIRNNEVIEARPVLLWPDGTQEKL